MTGFSKSTIRKMDDDSFPSEDDSSVDFEEELSNLTLLRIRKNYPRMKKLKGAGNDPYIQTMIPWEWEELGRVISNNTHLRELDLYDDALNDLKMSSLFRGLTRSDTIEEIQLRDNHLSVAGVQCMVPFLQSTNSVIYLNLIDNNIQSEGFNMLWRVLRDSPIESLFFTDCGIESIEIDSEHKPKHLETLYLTNNSINADGCRELAKLVQGADATLKNLSLVGNEIDDQGVDILVDALRKNTSLMRLHLEGNDGISKQGYIAMLKLVNDVSSINATFQSNHTLKHVGRDNSFNFSNDVKTQVQELIDMATRVNMEYRYNSEAVGKGKILQTQLNSSTRAELAELQGVSQSLYSEISPLHLPEVLALVCRYHGVWELYVALKSSIAGVISTVNRKQCLQQQRTYHRARIDAIEAEIAEIEAMEKAAGSHIGSESRSSKRRRA